MAHRKSDGYPVTFPLIFELVFQVKSVTMEIKVFDNKKAKHPEDRKGIIP